MRKTLLYRPKPIKRLARRIRSVTLAAGPPAPLRLAFSRGMMFFPAMPNERAARRAKRKDPRLAAAIRHLDAALVALRGYVND